MNVHRFRYDVASYRETLEGAVRSAACRVLGVADGIDRVLDVPERPFPLLGAADDYTDGVREFYRESICPDPASDPYPAPGPTPIFPGPEQGNCPTGYNGTVVFSSSRFGQGVTRTRGIPGPGARWRVVGDTVGQNQQLQLINDAGTVLPEISFTPADEDELIVIDSQEFARIDGLPDDCPEAAPPGPPRVEDPITYDPPTGPPVTISPVITFPPVVIDRSNNLIVPVIVAYANVRVTANLNLNVGSINFNFGRGSGGGKDCCPPPQIPGTPPTDPDGTPPPAEDVVIQGVIITVTQLNATAPATRVLNPNGPNAYFPDLGLVWFRVRVDRTLPWLPPIKIQGTFTLIRCPWPEGAVDVSAIAREGVNFTITLVYANVSSLGS